MQEITNLAGGAIIGFGLAWMLERWVMSFVRRLSVAEPEELLQENAEIFSKLFPYWGIYIGAGHDKKDQAIKAIKDILNKYQSKGMSKKDFNTVKKMIQGQNLLNIQTNDDYANFYSIAALHNLGFDYQHDSFQKIEDMKFEEFNKFLNKFLIDDWNIVEVGKMS